jgi:hypothetical protein
MTNRLPYETKGGALSEAETFAQLLEYLRMAEEACYTLGHWFKAQDDELKGQGFLAVGQMLDLTGKNVTRLATKSHRVLS